MDSPMRYAGVDWGTRIDALRAEHGGMIAGRSAAKQARYRAILRQVQAPSLVPLKLPEVAIFRRGTASLPGHVYAESGEALIYLNGWEADTISPQTAKPSTIGWLRNGEREGWFCVPWREVPDGARGPHRQDAGR